MIGDNFDLYCLLGWAEINLNVLSISDSYHCNSFAQLYQTRITLHIPLFLKHTTITEDFTTTVLATALQCRMKRGLDACWLIVCLFLFLIFEVVQCRLLYLGRLYCSVGWRGAWMPVYRNPWVVSQASTLHDADEEENFGGLFLWLGLSCLGINDTVMLFRCRQKVAKFNVETSQLRWQRENLLNQPCIILCWKCNLISRFAFASWFQSQFEARCHLKQRTKVWRREGPGGYDYRGGMGV